MTRFVLGMVAAGLWIAATVAVILLTRRSPAPPDRSIRSFRRARQRLAPRRAPTKSVSQDEPKLASPISGPPPPPGPPRRDPHPLDAIEEIPVMEAPSPPTPSPPHLDPPTTDVEMAEIAAVLEVVTDESGAGKRHRVAPPSDRRPGRGPRKVGRLTYVLVDDEGKPLD